MNDSMEQTPAVTEVNFQTIVELIQRLEQRLDNELGTLNARINRSRQREEELHGNVEGLRQAVRQPGVNDMATLPNAVKLPKLSKVDGRDEKVLRRFFRRIEGYLAAYQLAPEDHRSLFFVAQHFTGALEDWWENRQKSTGDNIKAGFSSFAELREQVFLEFQGRDPAMEARDNLDRARQRGSVKEYASYIRQQLLYLPARDDADNLHAFRKGLKHEIDAALALRRPNNLAEAVEFALEVEASLLHRRGESKRGARFSLAATRKTNSTTGDSSSEEDAEEETVAFKAAIPARKKRFGYKDEDKLKKLQAAGKCFHCEEKGHLSRECPHRKKKTGQKVTKKEEPSSSGDE